MPCLENEGCETTSCVKGLCCTVLCDGPGESCELADHRGVCVTRCVGDCSGDRVRSVDELVTAVNIALGLAPRGSCEIADANGDGTVHVSELIAAVNSALAGCDFGVSESWQQDQVSLVSSTCRADFTDQIRRDIAVGGFDCRHDLEQNRGKVTATACGPDYTGTIDAHWRLTLKRTQRYAGGNCATTIIDTVALEPAVSQTTARRTTAYGYSDGCGIRDCSVTIEARWTRLPPG